MAKAIILDIEGTVAPISFVKDNLFPFFLQNFKSYISSLPYPITPSDDLSTILAQFPSDKIQSFELLSEYIESLVVNDVKESALKAFQGLVWQKGYDSGLIKAPIYSDFLTKLHEWKSQGLKIYIYSSGSIKAQKLLFNYVDDNNGKSIDINPKLDGYFDITTSGYKQESSSYANILKDIGLKGEDVIFLSDNYLEVKASIEQGIDGIIVIRPGNAPLSNEAKTIYKTVTSFNQLEI